MAPRGRHAARRLLVQALYQMQLTGDDPDELAVQFESQPGFAKADKAYFSGLLQAVCADAVELEARISRYGDIPAAQIDPVEKAIMWVALTELRLSNDVPIGVVINEAVELAKIFGAEGGYRYVNGVLDKAATELR